jgi:hypothetical protein
MASPARTALSGSPSKTATISSPRTSWIIPLQAMIGSSTARRNPIAKLLASSTSMSSIMVVNPRISEMSTVI